MELELGLKITRTRDDITSISEYGVAKDRAGPVFQSRETNTMFILTAHLRGYKRNNIDIKISEDGSKISISGEKPIQEMFLVGWVMLKKEVEITGFHKVFKIPDGVILDQIKAKYDEEEWILKIVMPKLVKGICGARIEEVKEEESDRGRSELEQSEDDNILKSVGETSQKGSKESEIQEMEDSGSVMEKKEGGLSEKMLDEANGDIIGETFPKEIEESKLEIKDGNGESVRQMVGKEAYEAMKTSDLEQNVGASIPQKTGDTSQGKESEVQNMEDSESAAQKKKRVVSDKMLDDTNGNIIGETFQKEIEESKWEIKDGNGGSVRQKVGNEGDEVMKESELEQNVGASIPQKIGDTSQDKESKIQKMEESVMDKKEGGISNKMLHDANREIIGEAIQKEIEESKLGSEDGNGERVREKVGKEGYEVMKTAEVDRKVGVCISQKIGKIGDTSLDKESEVQKMEDSEIVEKKERGVFDKMLDDANGDIIGDTSEKEIEESKLRIKDGNGESVREKVGKVEYEAMKTSDLKQNVGTRIPQNIGDTSHDNEYEIQEMEDSESVVKKKERVVSDKILDDAHGNIIRETLQKEIEESKREIKDGNEESVRQKVGKEGYEVMKTSELDQNVGASIPKKIGDPSQDKESEVQKIEDSESAVETKEGGISDKMFDDVNREIIGVTIQKEIEESKLGIEDGNGERVKEKVGKEGYEVMKTSELEQNVGVCISQKFGDTSQDKESDVQKMEDSESVEKKEGGVSDKMLDDANGDIIGVTIQKEIEESKLGIEDGKVESVKEKVGKAAYEAVKTSEIEQNVGTGIPQNIGDTGQDKEFEVQEMEDNGSVVEKEKMVSDKKLDDANENTIEEMIQKEIEESKLGNEDGDGESVREKVGKAGYEAMKTLEQDQNVADHIPSNIGGISQEEPRESRIQQMEKTENVEGKMDGGESKRMCVEANKAIQKNIFGETNQKDIEKPKIETEDGDQECMREKAGKEGFEAMINVREEFPTQLPKATLDEGEGLNVSKMQDVKEAKEAMVKREGKEIECFVEKGEGEKPKRMHMEAKKLIEKDTTKETRQEEIEKPNNGTKYSDQQIIQENIVKGRFEVSNGITEELPKQVGEKLLDGSKGFKVEKMEEPKEVIKEAMAETESSMEKVEGEESKKRTEEASRDIEKSAINETLQKKTEESNIERKARDEPYVSDNIVKGVIEVLGTVQEKLPKQVVDAMAQDEHDKIEYGIVKLKGEGSTKMHVEANEVFEEDTTRDRIEKENREPKLKSSDQLSGQENVDNKGFDGSKRLKFPKMGETEDVKEKGAKIEESVKKVSGEKYEKIQVEAKGGFRKDITRETTQKEIEDPKIQTKEKDQQCLQEEVSKGRLEASKAAKEEFPMKMVDSLGNKRKGLKDTKIEKVKEVKEELVKQKSEEKVGETEDVKEEGAEIEQFVKKVKGGKHEKIQAEINGGLRKDITKETTWKETKEPKIQSKEKDQQCLQEEMSKGRFEASTTTREFPMQIVDSLAKKTDGPKDKKIEKAEEVKEEVAKRKTEETKVVESTTKEKFQDSEAERITQTLQEMLVEKHPKALEIDTPEREFQSTKSPTTCPKVVSMGFKEVEQGSAKDKTQKTELLPAKIQSKETHESKNERVNQDILKPKRAKEVGEGEQCTYNIESTKVVTTFEDQVAKPLPAPRFPSTQQSEVEEKGKLYESCKAKYEASPESQKEDPTKYLQNAIEMKEIKESKQTETLKPEIPLKEHLKKGEQVTRKDEFHKGQKVGETMQEETEEPKNKIDGRDQRDVQRDVGKRAGIVETIGKEMPKEEYVADAGPIAGRMETKRYLEATLEREKYIKAQNVNDEKPRIKEELRKAEIEKVDKARCIAESMEMTQENGHPRKSKAVEKDAEPQEVISSLPRVTSTGFKEAGPKNEIEELHQKDIKAPKIEAYQGAKPSKLQSPTLTQQSIDEENRKSENVVEAHEASKESPKKNTHIDFQESNEWMAPVENEKLETLQPQILVNQCLEEKQKVDGQEEALGECRFQEINQEEIKGPKILIEDRGQECVQDNNDKKGYRTTNAVEDELLKREHKAEIVLEKREGPKVAKSEETKEASKQILERGRVKITQTAEDKKPKMKEIAPKFEKDNGFKQVVEKMLAPRERETKEPQTMIEITPNKGTEKSQTEEMSPLPVEIQRKEPRELSWPSMEHEIPKIEGVQQEKEGERPIHALEATNSKEKGHAQATTTHSKAKGNVEPKVEIDKAQSNQLPSPSKEMLSKGPYELDKFSIKEDGSKVESLPQVREGRESIHSIEGTTASEAVADKVAKPSKFSSSSSTQQFEVERKDKMDASHEVGNQESQESKKKDSKVDVQESTKSKTDQEVEHIETPQPVSPTNQQCINKDREESHGIHEIEEIKANEQGDEAPEKNSQVLEEQKEGKDEASGGKKDDTKRSKKLFVPLVIAGSTLLVSLIVIFVRRRRARKSNTK